MIRLPYGYGISATAFDYSFGKIGISNKKNPKTGVVEQIEVIQAPIYPSSIESCIRNLMRIKQREIVADNDLTLSEALQKLAKLNVEFEQLLKETVATKEQLKGAKENE